MAKPLKFQIIERAKELIQNEQHWCRGSLAIDASGDSADPTSKEAVRRCAFGALIAAAHQLTNSRSRSYELAGNALRLCGTNTVILTNDHQGHAAVLALFDEAMAAMWRSVLGSDLDSQFEKRIQESQSRVTCFKMQQKTDGRVVRLLTKHLATEDQLEQWFLVAIADDEKAKDAVAKTAKGADEVIEVVGNIPARSLASWGLTDGEVRLVLPGEPINSTA